MADDTTKQIHHGRNLERIRRMLRVSQESLANKLEHMSGEEWTQKRVSRLEDKEKIEDELMKQVADALNIPVEAIKNFDEEAAINYFNTFNESTINGFAVNHYTFNSIDKVSEMYEKMLKEKDEEIKRLREEKNGK